MAEVVRIEDITPKQMASITDHTFLNRSEQYKDATMKSGVNSMCIRAEEFRRFVVRTKNQLYDSGLVPYSLCVRPEDVGNASALLHKNGMDNIKIASVVGFPDGSLYDTDLKVLEANYAMRRGASEIDMVLNYEALRRGDIDDVKSDIRRVVFVVHDMHDRGGLLKLILETSILRPHEIKSACKIASELGVDFVKTSTGFGAYGARVEDLEIMRANFSKGIKISGGVNKDNVHDLLRAASGRTVGMIELDPLKVRIGASSSFLESYLPSAER